MNKSFDGLIRLICQIANIYTIILLYSSSIYPVDLFILCSSFVLNAD